MQICEIGLKVSKPPLPVLGWLPELRELSKTNSSIEIPSPDKLMALRQGDRYEWFLDECVRWVVGAQKFDRLKTKKRISEFVYPTDEGFALLVYENQKDRWEEMSERNLTSLTKAARYTDGGGGRDIPKQGRSRRNCGWSHEGMERFNELCRLVVADRSAGHAKAFEDDYLSKKIEEKERANSGKRVRERKMYGDDELEMPRAFNDMGSVLGGINVVCTGGSASS